jgi:hypothetical protein
MATAAQLEARNLLADALESGEYQQGRSQLTKIENGVEKHCCLGVACNVLEKLQPGTFTREVTEYSPSEVRYCYGDSKASLYAPKPVQDWLGIDHVGSLTNSIVIGDLRGVSLADLNDSGVKFTDIAKVLRTHSFPGDVAA